VGDASESGLIKFVQGIHSIDEYWKWFPVATCTTTDDEGV